MNGIARIEKFIVNAICVIVPKKDWRRRIRAAMTRNRLVLAVIIFPHVISVTISTTGVAKDVLRQSKKSALLMNEG